MDSIFYLCMSSVFGGAERVGLRVAQHLSVRPYSKIFINKSIAVDVNPDTLGYSKIYIPKLCSKISTNPLSTVYLLITSIWFYGKHRPKTGTIFYCNDIESIFIVLLSKILCKGRIVWHLHDVFNLRKIGTHLVVNAMLFFVDMLICITKANADRMRPLYHGKIVVIPNYSRLRPSEPPCRSKIFDRNEIAFGYIGQISSWKRVDLAINFVVAMNSSHGLRSTLQIAGLPLFNSDYEYYNKLIRATDGNSAIKWIGSVANATQFYSGIDFLVLFSRNEPFGLVLVEALSQGVPLVASPGDGPDAILKKSIGFMLDPVDAVSQLSVLNALKELTQEKYAEMSRCAVEEARLLYSEESFALRVTEALEFFDLR